jgi:hypothetical protein
MVKSKAPETTLATDFRCFYHFCQVSVIERSTLFNTASQVWKESLSQDQFQCKVKKKFVIRLRKSFWALLMPMPGYLCIEVLLPICDFVHLFNLVFSVYESVNSILIRTHIYVRGILVLDLLCLVSESNVMMVFEHQ